MSKVQFQPTGKQDERLSFLLEKTKEGATTFIQAVKTTKEYGVSFKSFTLKTKSDDEAKTVFDVMMSAIAIEIAEQAKELIYEKTFFHTVERDSEEEISLWLHCKNEKPPTKEEIDEKAKEENEKIYDGVQLKIEMDEKKVENQVEEEIAEKEECPVKKALEDMKFRVLSDEEKAAYLNKD